MSVNITVILVLMYRHDAEMVVVEAGAELVVVHFVHYTFVNALKLLVK